VSRFKWVPDSLKYSVLGVAGLGVLSYFAGWWPSIVQVVLFIGQWIVAQSTIPNWIFIISGVAISWKFIAYGRSLQNVKKELKKLRGSFIGFVEFLADEEKREAESRAELREQVRPFMEASASRLKLFKRK